MYSACIIKNFVVKMAFTFEEFEKWNVDTLKTYLSERGVPLRSAKKLEMIRMCLLTQELQLPVLPTVPEKSSEIMCRRSKKLTVDGIKIPFPEELELGWMSDFTYIPHITMDCLKRYAKKSISEKSFREGMNLNSANHVSNVQFNNISSCIKYAFVKGIVVPQTRILENPYQVWICLNCETCDILTGECGCIAGYSEACKHVFALLNFIENIVTSGKNKTCTSQKQKWDQKISKKGYKIHKPSPLSAINFDRPHPEYESGFVKPKRSTFDPRPLKNRTSSFKWNDLISMSDGNSSVLCFKNFTSNITSDHDYQLMPVSSPVLNPYTLPEIVDINNYNTENFSTCLYNYRTPEIISEIENLTTGQSSNSLWFSYRCGVITASVAHTILSICKRFKSAPGAIERIVA